MTMSEYEQIQRWIMQRDPAGWQTQEPTELDYAAFKVWAIRSYGADAWRAYVGK